MRCCARRGAGTASGGHRAAAGCTLRLLLHAACVAARPSPPTPRTSATLRTQTALSLPLALGFLDLCACSSWRGCKLMLSLGGSLHLCGQQSSCSGAHDGVAERDESTAGHRSGAHGTALRSGCRKVRAAVTPWQRRPPLRVRCRAAPTPAPPRRQGRPQPPTQHLPPPPPRCSPCAAAGASACSAAAALAA